LLVGDKAAETKVGNFDKGKIHNKNILRLKIAVGNSEGMAIRNRGDDLLENKGGRWFVEFLVIDNVIEKFTARTQIDNKIEVSIIPKEIIESNQIVVAEIGHRINFALESALIAIVSKILLSEDFYRIFAIRLRILAFADVGE
jgi:hypothetical protein